MLHGTRLTGRSIWNGRRLAATQPIQWSAPRTIGAAARLRGTRHRRRHAHAERKKQGNKYYGEKAHDDYLLSLTVMVKAICAIFFPSTAMPIVDGGQSFRVHQIKLATPK